MADENLFDEDDDNSESVDVATEQNSFSVAVATEQNSLPEVNPSSVAVAREENSLFVETDKGFFF